MIRLDTDLFGEPIPPSAGLRKDGGRRRIGYAARPGTGPKRQRCNTCKHALKVLHTETGVRSLKCTLMSHLWSDDPVTDIKPGAPACREWVRKPFVPVSEKQS